MENILGNEGYTNRGDANIGEDDSRSRIRAINFTNNRNIKERSLSTDRLLG